MLFIRITFYSLLLYAGAIVYESNTLSVNKEIQPYYVGYTKLMNNHCLEVQHMPMRGLTIDFDDLEYPTIGVCSYNLLGLHRISVDRQFWDSAPDVLKTELIYHELTHCYFHVGHTPDPSNYMYPAIRWMTYSELELQVNDFLTKRCGK